MPEFSNVNVLYLGHPKPQKMTIRSIFTALCIICFNYLIHAQFTEDFGDGNFTIGNSWSGDVAEFVVNSDLKLQLNDDMAEQSYLSTPVELGSLDDVEWRMQVRQSFSGSSNNFSRVYLTSQQGELSFSSNNAVGAFGYFLLFGESGSNDAVRLFRDDNLGDAPVEILAGTEGQVASAFEIGIRVTRDALGEWSLFVDPTGGNEYVFEASESDQTYTSSAFTGVVCNYTISNADNFFFDDFYVGAIDVDTTVPVAESVTVVDITTLSVNFSEPVEALSAENVSNYNVLGFGTPISASADGTVVTLNFAGDLPENIEQTIEISGVSDTSGNQMVPQSFNFTYVVSAQAEAGDVVINEILPDPTPSLGLPEYEFVELFNSSQEFFDLADWTFVNTTTEKILPSTPLPPGGFVILCDESAVPSFELLGPVIGIPSFTALVNSGDSLTLRSAENNIMDIVVYTDEWYGDPLLDDGGVSLERINPFGGCSGANNWSASVAFAGGSPGSQNTVFSDSPDENAPEVLDYFVSGDNQLTVLFNEELDFNAPADIVADILELNLSGLNFGSGLNEVVVTFQENIEPGNSYVLTLENISDCEGNTSAEVLELTFEVGFVPEPGDLIITEIMADPDDDLNSPNEEYVEIYNTTDQVLEITGVTLSEATFAQQVLIEPGEYLIVCNVDNLLAFFVWPGSVGMDSFPGLTNSGRLIELRAPNGDLLDAVNYSIDWYGDASKDDGGWSLERISLDLPCSNARNWTASNDPSGATPQLPNSVLDETPDIYPPVISEVNVVGETEVEVVFNEPLDPDLSGLEFVLGQSEGSFDDLGYMLISAILLQDEDEFYPQRVLLNLDQTFVVGPIYELRVAGVPDCSGNAFLFPDYSSGRFATPEEHELGDLIINEVLFNPSDDGVDYVEIYNRSKKNINIEGWKLGNATSDDVISTKQRVVFKGEYLLLSENSIAVLSEYQSPNLQSFLDMEGLPSYNNDDGLVVLMDSLEQESDLFVYSSDQHYPLLNDLNGVSLERIDPNTDTDQVTNWHSASEASGFGTPGYLNSQFGALMTFGELSLSPNVFSPDNDGFEDVLFISLELPEPGYNGTLTIFNDAGRAVRKLVQNQLLGINEQFTWDGFDDDRNKAPIGMYIVLFEGFTPSGDKVINKAVGVLGAPLD